LFVLSRWAAKEVKSFQKMPRRSSNIAPPPMPKPMSKIGYHTDSGEFVFIERTFIKPAMPERDEASSKSPKIASDKGHKKVCSRLLSTHFR
jgi:hypothetical protein